MENEDFEIESGTGSGVNLPKDVGLYWIHCNRCFEIYVHRRRRIFLLACNHTICEKCAETPSLNAQNGSNEVVCPLCKKTQRFRVLCNVMPAHFKELMNPEPWHEPSDRILSFQGKQRESFKKGMYHKLYQLDEIRKRCKLLEINCKKKYERYEQLRIERKRLEREVCRFKELESRPQNMRQQVAQRNTYSNPKFNRNAFSKTKHIRTDDTTRSYNGGGNTQRTILNNNSFSFSLI